MTVPRRMSRRGVWWRAIGASLVFLTGTMALGTLLPSVVSESWPLRIAVALGGMQLLTVGLVVVELMIAKLRAQAGRRRLQRVAPAIRLALVSHSLGDNDGDELRELRERYPGPFEQCLVELLEAVEGPARYRLGQLAEQLGIVEAWARQLRSRRFARQVYAVRALGLVRSAATRDLLVEALEGQDQEIRQAAAQALGRHGERKDVVRVFEYAVRQPPWDRAVLGEVLARHADLLAEQAIPRLLSDAEGPVLRSVLELAVGWNIKLPYTLVAPLLEHKVPAVRARAVRLLPNSIDQGGWIETALSRRLQDPSDDVRTAAAEVAGRQRRSTLIASLTACAEGAGARAPLAAAMALAGFGPRGLEVLQRLAVGENDRVALAATEAVERAHIGRLRLAAAG